MSIQTTQGYLTGQVLAAMPQMGDPRFARSVIYLCAHSADGAMGLVVNRPFSGISFPQLLEQLNIPASPACEKIRIHSGGPVESGRGFVLHSSDIMLDSSMPVDDGIALTATVDMLRTIANGTGPRRLLLALGYAGWGSGQLDEELRENAWLNLPADEDLLFGVEMEHKWERAIHKLGIDMSALSCDAGHA